MILQAIKNKNPDEAAYLMDQHMNFLVDQVRIYNDYVKLHPEFLTKYSDI